MLFGCLFGFGQVLEPLQIGDNVPSGTVIGTDFTTGAVSVDFESLRGKLVILDFWHSGCASCIASFPRMEKLQKQFDGDIQIFLVNTFEDSAQLRKRMMLPNFSKIAETKLPIVVDAKELAEYFPHNIVPHHVWVDAKGVVRVIGSSLNTHPEKIKNLLTGKTVSVLKNSNNSIEMPDDVSLHELLKKSIVKKNNQTHVVFSEFLNNYPSRAKKFIDVPVDATEKVRDTYVNHEVLELYRNVFKKQLDEQHQSIIFSGKFSYGTTRYWLNYFRLDVADTISLTQAYTPDKRLTDWDFINSRYCYEQVVPRTYSSRRRESLMLSALNGYFGSRLGIKASLIKKSVPCHVLRIKNVPRANVKLEVSSVRRSVLKSELGSCLQGLYEHDALPPNLYLIDETGLENVDGLDLRIDEGSSTFGDIKCALEECGISITEESRELNFVSIQPVM